VRQDELAHIHVVPRVGHRLATGARSDAAHRAELTGWRRGGARALQADAAFTWLGRPPLTVIVRVACEPHGGLFHGILDYRLQARILVGDY
jgi:hypothetical protein